jgi:peptidoglycan hydrolase CwlO-like protein
MGVLIISLLFALNTGILNNNFLTTKQNLTNSQKIIQDVNKDLEKINNQIKEKNDKLETAGFLRRTE